MGENLLDDVGAEMDEGGEMRAWRRGRGRCGWRWGRGGREESDHLVGWVGGETGGDDVAVVGLRTAAVTDRYK